MRPESFVKQVALQSVAPEAEAAAVVAEGALERQRRLPLGKRGRNDCLDCWIFLGSIL